MLSWRNTSCLCFLASNSFCLFIEQIICHHQIPQKQAKNPSNPHKIGLKAIFSLNEVEASDTICVKSDKNCQKSMTKPHHKPALTSPSPTVYLQAPPRPSPHAGREKATTLPILTAREKGNNGRVEFSSPFTVKGTVVVLFPPSPRAGRVGVGPLTGGTPSQQIQLAQNRLPVGIHLADSAHGL